MKTAFYISLILTIIGGVNWGFVGLMGIDLVAVLFGSGATLANIVYGLVGLAAITLGVLSSNIIIPTSSNTAVKRTRTRTRGKRAAA